MTDKPILSNEDRLEMLKFYQTITVDGNGKAVKMKYDEHIVRHDTLRLLADTEHFLTIIESKDRTIKTYEEVQQGWLDSHAKNFKQIESLKAITELAVKGLEWYAGERYGSVQFMPPIPDIMILRDCGKCAKDTLSEIAKLSHE